MHNFMTQQKWDILSVLTLFDMGFFEPSIMGGGEGHEVPHHNFVVIAPMIMKFSTSIMLDLFQKMVTKRL